MLVLQIPIQHQKIYFNNTPFFIVSFVLSGKEKTVFIVSCLLLCLVNFSIHMCDNNI